MLLLLPVFLCSASVSLAAPTISDGSYRSQDEHYPGVELVTPPSYAFDYRVHANEDEQQRFGQQEYRNEVLTSGQYYVQLPDGRVQTVSYTVDGNNGFVAEVSYEPESKNDYHTNRV